MKMTWSGWQIIENYHVLLKQFHGNFPSKTLSCRRIIYVFRDIKWWFDASWGFKGLNIIQHITGVISSSYLLTKWQCVQYMWSRILYLDQSSLFFIWPAFVGKRNHFVFGVAWWHSQQVWRKWSQTPYTPVNTITQCWYNVEAASQTMAQQCTNIGWMCRVYYRHTCKFLRSPRILIQHLFNFGVTSDESKSIFTPMRCVLHREYRIHYFKGDLSPLI